MADSLERSMLEYKEGIDEIMKDLEHKRNEVNQLLQIAQDMDNLSETERAYLVTRFRSLLMNVKHPDRLDAGDDVHTRLTLVPM